MWTYETLKDSIELLILQYDFNKLLTTRNCLVISSTLLVGYVWNRSRRTTYSIIPRWPPGPKAWPWIGNFFSIRPTSEKRIMDNFHDLMNEYGNMVHIYMGMGYDLIIINDVELIYEAFIEKSAYFSDRPLHMHIFDGKRDKGVVLQNGQKLKKNRKFIIHTMKELGLGKHSLHMAIQDEARQMVDIFLKHEGTPVNPKCTIYSSVSNIICSMIFNERYNHEDPKFQKILKCIEAHFVNGGLVSLITSFLPASINIRLFPEIKDLEIATQEMKAFIASAIEKHRLDFDENQLRDFIDYYLKCEIDNRENSIPENDMFTIITDLFLTGSETTSTVLNWLVLYLVHYPDVQLRCRQEIHMVIGTGREPMWKDKGTLPYMEATLLEIQRIANIAPTGVIHGTSAPVELGGYLLPERTLIYANLSECLTSDRYWSMPDTFSPDRWMTGAELRPELPNAFIPFGIGQRKCPGDNLAKMELFIFATTLLQRLEFKPEIGVATLPSLRGVHKSVHFPQPYKVSITSCL